MSQILFECFRCKEKKPRDQFGTAYQYYVRADGSLKQYVYRKSYCEDCRSTYNKAWHKANPKKLVPV